MRGLFFQLEQILRARVSLKSFERMILFADKTFLHWQFCLKHIHRAQDLSLLNALTFADEHFLH